MAPSANPAGDQRLAQTLVLDQNDFPDGWTFAPHARDPRDAESSRKVAACLGRPDPATTQTAKATQGLETLLKTSGGVW